LGLSGDPESRETCELIIALVTRLGLRVLRVDWEAGTVTVTAPEVRSVRSLASRSDL
jgi:hypothetical protein